MNGHAFVVAGADLVLEIRHGHGGGVWIELNHDPAALAEDVSVSQKNRAFAPAELSLKLGDRLVFENDDTVTHNMFSRDPGFKFNLKMQEPGGDKSVVMESRGRATIRCAIHPQMKLSIAVE